MSGLIARFGEGPVAAALLALALVAALQPVLAWFARARWPKVGARVTDIPTRRSLASGKWSVEVVFTAPDGREVTTRVPVNIARRPLKRGDRIEIMHHPRTHTRTALTRLEGASAGFGLAGLCLIGALALLHGGAG
ncbi:DUF3592 domain-containing protein [Limibaculum sp. FT325]|uniref:DUF3592 domain-containing protein n=1 Tax=Thermohalobaculum sediminis TaxID=2939436 RepID=UPI0020C0418A|nr:DUF3592 domain-containing protein [Limibaculum sediminis]MCL5777348.1 DUF3592 domain-containing protein [Limibaculum sediminis]